MSAGDHAAQEWKADRYAEHAPFVPLLGLPVLELLAPKPGERILDVGCGEGALSEKILEAGATIVGVDGSPDMVAAARQRGIGARLVDAFGLTFEAEFDAAFSKAALHWMKRDPDAVLEGVRRSLKPGGRFVGDSGATVMLQPSWWQYWLHSVAAALRGLPPEAPGIFLPAMNTGTSLSALVLVLTSWSCSPVLQFSRRTCRAGFKPSRDRFSTSFPQLTKTELLTKLLIFFVRFSVTQRAVGQPTMSACDF